MRVSLHSNLLWFAVLWAPGAIHAQEAPDEVIRPLDKITLANGNTMEGIVETPGDLSTLSEVVITTRGGASRIRLKRSEVQSILPRQGAEEVYKTKRKRLSGETAPEKRAQGELELAVWCQTPRPELEGKAPRAEAALLHFLRAAELQPSLPDVYPHLLTLLPQPAEPGASTSSFDREARVALLAEAGGYKDPEIDFRLGVYFAETAGLPGRAKECFERVLAAGHKNLGQLRKARSFLRDIYLSSGEPEKAIAMYEAAITQGETSPENFEPQYELGRLHAMGGGSESIQKARERFTKALAIQPDFLEASAELAALDYRSQAFPQAEKTLRALLVKDPGNVPVSISLGLVLVKTGKLKAAEELLKGLVGQADDLDKARALLGMGLIREAKGDELGAITNYREAMKLDPSLVEAKVATAMALLRAGQPADARAQAEELVSLTRESPAVFAAYSRILGEAELADGKPDAALPHLLRAVEVDANDANLFERVGLLYLRLGKLDSGFAMLLKARQAGGERPDTINGMAFYHYSRGQYDDAKKAFESVLKLVKEPPKSASRDVKPLPIPAARLYALRGKELIEDLGRLETWVADLSGPDAATLDGWQETERFGVEVTRKGGQILIEGKQATAADGVTAAMLDRPVDTTTFERASASVRLESGKARVAIRLEGYAKTGGAATGIIFYRDFDGFLRAQVKTASGDWEAVPRTEDVPPEGGKLVNAGTTAWPQDAAYHTLEIRRSGRPGTGPGSSSRVAGLFDLYFDGQPVAWNVKVAGIGGRTYDVGISGQTDAVGNEYKISVESFKVYRAAPEKKSKARF